MADRQAPPPIAGAGPPVGLALNPLQKSANIKLKSAVAILALLYKIQRMAAPNISPGGDST
jgi:hypothetical protein